MMDVCFLLWPRYLSGNGVGRRCGVVAVRLFGMRLGTEM
jgi:hypothetical protein